MALAHAENIITKYGQPSLDLQFSGPKGSLKDRMGGVEVEFTRSSVGTYVGSDGLIKTAVADEARFDHDPVTNESLGLLIEETRANIYKYSNLMNPTGNSVPSNFTDNAGTAPDGTNTALKLVERPSSDGVVDQGQGFAIGAKDGPLAVFSVFAKAGEDRYLFITPYLGASRTPPVFDLQTGAISNPDNHAVVMEPFADGWYRCSVRVGRTGFASMKWGISNVANAPFSNNGIPFEGDGTSGLYVWGAQYELQTPSAANGDSPIEIVASSLIPTSGSTVTRAGDVCSITGTDFSSWYNQSEGSLVVEYSDQGFPKADGGNKKIVSISENSLSLMTSFRGYSLGNSQGADEDKVQFVWWDDAGRTYGAKASTLNKAAIAYSSDPTDGLAYDGTIVTTRTNGQPKNTMIGLYFFQYQTISRLTYWPKRLTDTSLQSLTQ